MFIFSEISRDYICTLFRFSTNKHENYKNINLTIHAFRWNYCDGADDS